jgi:hypothetical protein
MILAWRPGIADLLGLERFEEGKAKAPSAGRWRRLARSSAARRIVSARFVVVLDPLNVPHFSRPKYRFKPYDRLSDERQPVLSGLEVFSGVKPKKVKRVSATARGRMFRIGAFSRLHFHTGVRRRRRV